jgi:hypothetical protein
MDFSIFPPEMKQAMEHVPIVIYFPRGVWDRYMVMGHGWDEIKIMGAREMRKHGDCYCLETIQGWLQEVVLLEEEGDDEIRQKADEACDEILSEVDDRSTELIDYAHDPPRIITFKQYQKEQTLNDRFRHLQQSRNHGTLTLVPEMYDVPINGLAATQLECGHDCCNEVAMISSEPSPSIVTLEATHEGVLFSLRYDAAANIINVSMESQVMKVLMALDLNWI